jgi:hypothetical protein
MMEKLRILERSTMALWVGLSLGCIGRMGVLAEQPPPFHRLFRL